MLQKPKVVQCLHQDICQQVDKINKIATVGVIFIVLCITLSVLPRMFDGYVKDSVWAIICLTLVSAVSVLSALYLIGDNSHWSFGVIRYCGFANSVWFFLGVLYHIYGLFKGSEPMSDLIAETLQERFALVFGFGFFISIMHERWKMKQL